LLDALIDVKLLATGFAISIAAHLHSQKEYFEEVVS
jgi:hypothetical protein